MVGLRFRKSFKIAPGVRLNVGNKNTSISFGGKGLRYTLNSNGSRTSSVGISGTGLSYVSTSSGKSYKTSAYQKHQELQSLQKKIHDDQVQEQAKYEVDLYENRCELVQSIHKECDEPVDWLSIVNCPPPFPLGETGPKEKEALHNYESYRPGFFDRMFSKDEEEYTRLSQQIQLAKLEDEKDYKEWEELSILANKVLSGDIEAYFSVLKEMDPLGDLSEFGSGFEFSTDDPSYLEVEFDVQSKTIIPTMEKKLTKTGKLSLKQLSKTRYFELTQNYVCSSILRIARDLFSLLPLKTVYIHAYDEVLNTETGHSERILILSIKIDQTILESLNFETLQCSDAMNNFPHHMKFRKLKGFDSVEKISAENGSK